MDFVIIIGPPAVGKMTVGYELQQLTGLRLFHNHMTIDLVMNFFEWGTPQFKLVSEFRRRIFEEVAGSDLHGLIFTYVWAFDHPSDRAFIDECGDIFRRRGARIHYVELVAPLAVRLERNRTEFRLQHKPPKRDLERSEQMLRQNEERYRLNSNGDFPYPESYLRIDNTDLPAAAAARMIAERFGLPAR